MERKLYTEERMIKMPAPKGNQYAIGNKGGRPTKYKPEYCQDIIDYFSRKPVEVLYKREYHKDGEIKSETPIPMPAEFPTFQGFAHEIGVSTSALYEWIDEHQEFAEAFTRAKQLQESIWLVNGMSNLYNSQFAQFFGKNCLGYKEKTEIEHTGDPQIVNVTNIAVLPDSDLKQLELILSKALPAPE